MSPTTAITDLGIVATLLERAVAANPNTVIDGVFYSLAPTDNDQVGLYRFDEAKGDHVLIARADITLAVTSC